MRFNATTSIIQNTTANVVGSSTAFSMVVWLRALSVGESQGRVLVLDEAGNGIAILLVGTDIRFSRAFSGGSVFHDVGAAGWGLNQWVCYAVSYNATSGSVQPTIWTARHGSDGGLVSRAINTTTTTGTPTTPLSGFAIGNRSDTARTWDGDIAFLQVFDRVITRAEAEACMLRPGSIRKGRVLYAPLINDPHIVDKNGKRFSNTTTVAVTKNGGPKAIVESGRRKLALARVPGGAASIAGSAAGLATTSGTLKGRAHLQGSSDGSATASGTLNVPGEIAGTSAGSATVTGTLKGVGRLVGFFSGVDSTATGNLEGYARGEGSAQGTATVSGILKGIARLAGSADGQATATGTLASEFLAGVAAGVATASGTLKGRARLAGTSDGVATVLGDLAGIAEAQGSASGLATAVGILVGMGYVEGSAQGTATATAILHALAQISGSAAGSSTATGSLSQSGTIPQIISTISYSRKEIFIPTFISH